MINYDRYLVGVNKTLQQRGMRQLTKDEEVIVTTHLVRVTAAFLVDLIQSKKYIDNNVGVSLDIGGLSLMETLVLEAVKKVAEIHPEMPPPTEEGITRAIYSIIEE